jgi:hypothetical protein
MQVRGTTIHVAEMEHHGTSPGQSARPMSRGVKGEKTFQEVKCHMQE